MHREGSNIKCLRTYKEVKELSRCAEGEAKQILTVYKTNKKL